MNLTSANLDAIFYGYNMTWQAALTQMKVFWDQFATKVPSGGREERYAWEDRPPKMVEWIGERVAKNVSARGYSLINRDFEQTLKLKRNSVLDDQYGLLGSTTVPMMAANAAKWPDQQMVDILQNGHLTTKVRYQAYDGQPFFNGSHPINMDDSGAGTYSNYFTSTALNAANFNSTRATMMAYTGADGAPIGVMPNLLMVPPALEATGRQILQATFIAPAAAIGMNAASVQQSNVLTGMANILVNPYLAGQDTTWYLLDTTQVVRPFLFQLRQTPQFVYRNRPDDSNVFYKKEFIFGADARAGFGYSFPYFAAKGVA